MQFFDNNYLTNICDSSNSYVANSTGKGNFSGQKINIWRVLRGGNFNNIDGTMAASSRVCYDPYTHGFLVFRLALYVEQ